MSFRTAVRHARTEEEEVYPLIDRLIGGSHLTESLVRDHAEVRQLAQKLAALRERLVYSYFGPAQLRLLRGVLYLRVCATHGTTRDGSSFTVEKMVAGRCPAAWIDEP